MEGDTLVLPKNKGGRPRQRGPDGSIIERPAARVPAQTHPMSSPPILFSHTANPESRIE
jgi:hypothetical protein